MTFDVWRVTCDVQMLATNLVTKLLCGYALGRRAALNLLSVLVRPRHVQHLFAFKPVPPGCGIGKQRAEEVAYVRCGIHVENGRRDFDSLSGDEGSLKRNLG